MGSLVFLSATIPFISSAKRGKTINIKEMQNIKFFMLHSMFYSKIVEVKIVIKCQGAKHDYSTVFA